MMDRAETPSTGLHRSTIDGRMTESAEARSPSPAISPGSSSRTRTSVDELGSSSCPPGARAPRAPRRSTTPRLYGPGGDQRVEDVADRADAARPAGSPPAQPARVARAVPALVVGQRDLLGHLHDRRAAAGEDLGADRGVQAHPARARRRRAARACGGSSRARRPCRCRASAPRAAASRSRPATCRSPWRGGRTARLMRVMWRPVSGSRDSATCPSRWTISSCEWRRSWVRSRTRRSSIQLSRMTSSFSSISSRASTPSIRRTASGWPPSTASSFPRRSAPSRCPARDDRGRARLRSSTASSPNAWPGRASASSESRPPSAAHLERPRARGAGSAPGDPPRTRSRRPRSGAGARSRPARRALRRAASRAAPRSPARGR